MIRQDWEHTSGDRMTKWRGQVASIAPGLLSVSVLALTAGLASAQTTVTTPITGPQTVSVDEDVTVTADGSVTLLSETNEAVIEIDVADYTSDVLNQGTLTYMGGVAGSSAQGLLLTGGVSGTVTNEGRIELDVSDTDEITLIGIEVGELGTTGTLTNNGQINVTATTSGPAISGSLSASAFGIVASAVDGTITNSGTVSVSATADGLGAGLTASASGISPGDGSGSIDNSGTFSVTATASGTATSGSLSAEAYGIDSFGGGEGTITNSGTVSVSATADGSGARLSASASGIDTFDMFSSIDNSGTFNVTATASGTATSGSLSAEAYGIKSFGGGEGTITNSGTVSVSATASGTATNKALYASAHGIMSLGGGEGTITNSGTVSVSATADGLGARLSASASGIDTFDMFSSIDNSGTFNVTATASGTATSGSLSAEAYGIKSFGGGEGTITNSGTVSVSATADGLGAGLTAYANGINTFNLSGSIFNSGTISVIATADGSAPEFVVNAYGINAGWVGMTGSLSNTGLIMASAEVADGSNSSVFGIYTETLDGTLFNSGTVIAEAANGGQASAVRVEGGSGEATFLTTSRFVGQLSLQNAELTVGSVIGSGSIFWTFDDIPATVNLEQLGGPTLYRDGTTIATLDPANFSVAGQVAGEVASLGFDTVTALMAGIPAAGASVARLEDSPLTFSTAGTTGGERLMFVQGEFISRELDDATGRRLETDISGVTLGMVGTLSNGMGYGATLSGYSADGSVEGAMGPDAIDNNGVALGFYGSTGLGAATLTFGASFGALSNDSSRSVNDNTAPGGISTFTGEYNSRFFSPALELSYIMQSGGATIRPYIGYRYTRLSVDGFTEEGFGGATYAGRDVGVSDISLGMGMAIPIGNGTLSGSLEILSRNVDDPGTNTVLFGTNGNVTAAATDFTAVELGVGYGIAVGRGRLDISASAMIGSDRVSGFGGTVGYRIDF